MGYKKYYIFLSEIESDWPELSETLAHQSQAEE